MTPTLFNNDYTSLPSLLDKFFGGNLMDWNTRNYAGSNSTLPAVNVKENDNEFLIDVAAPGLEKNDFKLNYDNGRLTISSEKSENKEEKEGEVLTRKEFSYQSFQRTFTVPETFVNAEKISAKYNNGILHVTLPKREEIKPKPAKQIKIS
ncbi:Hsp20/alpha crystallin family protein [uncultured Draconibacterium sp.]|uniref:Hsp20/alpha crystallin family protein n=1 Tax=uncultured Draconibacterium sp. TaxID=1573823 RepID=UPI0032165874